MTRAKRIHDLEVQRQSYSTKHPNLVKKIVREEKKVETSRAKPLSDYARAVSPTKLEFGARDRDREDVNVPG